MSDVEAYEVGHGNPFNWNLKEVSEALGPPSAQSVQRQRRSRAQSSVENRRVQRMAGVGVLVPGQIHECFHVAADHDHEP